MLRSDLCDFGNGVNRNIDAYNRKLLLKSRAKFTSCISKIDNTFIDNAED